MVVSDDKKKRMLEKLWEAWASGATSVSYDDVSLSFDSMEKLEARYNLIADQLGEDPLPADGPRNIQTVFNPDL